MIFPETLLALDPSLTCTGWASFVDGVLDSCGYIAGLSAQHDLFTRCEYIAGNVPVRDVNRVCIEMPEVYAFRKGYRKPVPPNQIMKVQLLCGYLAARVRAYSGDFVLPKKWKGSGKKVATFAKVIRELTPGELATYNKSVRPKEPTTQSQPPSAKSRPGDTLDAVGLGLWALGRFV